MNIKNLENVLKRIEEIQNRFHIPQNNKNSDTKKLDDQSLKIQKNEIEINNEFLQNLIDKISEEEGVNSSLIKAIAQVESHFNPNALSKKGAIGIMQLMPQTAKELNVNPYKIDENIRGGIQYLKMLARKFKDLDLTLAAYNAGPANVEKYQNIPPFEETQTYVKKIKKILNDLQE